MNNSKSKWSFTCGNFNAAKGPLWSVSSAAIYESKGHALTMAYNECRKHGCPPAAVHIHTTEYKAERSSLDFALAN